MTGLDDAPDIAVIFCDFNSSILIEICAMLFFLLALLAPTRCPGAFSRVEIWHSASYPKLIVAAIRGDLPLDITGVVMVNSHDREVFTDAMIYSLLLGDVSRALIMTDADRETRQM